MAFEFIEQLMNATRPDNREGRSLSTMLRKRQRRRPEAMLNAYLDRDMKRNSNRFQFPGGRGGFGL